MKIKAGQGNIQAEQKENLSQLKSCLLYHHFSKQTLVKNCYFLFPSFADLQQADSRNSSAFYGIPVWLYVLSGPFLHFYNISHPGYQKHKLKKIIIIKI